MFSNGLQNRVDGQQRVSGHQYGQVTVHFYGGEANDVLDGSAADRRLVGLGGGGDDLLIGGAGADMLNGGSGDDLIYSYSIDFNASVSVNDGPNVLDGGDGNVSCAAVARRCDAARRLG